MKEMSTHSLKPMIVEGQILQKKNDDDDYDAHTREKKHGNTEKKQVTSETKKKLSTCHLKMPAILAVFFGPSLSFFFTHSLFLFFGCLVRKKFTSSPLAIYVLMSRPASIT